MNPLLKEIGDSVKDTRERVIRIEANMKHVLERSSIHENQIDEVKKKTWYTSGLIGFLVLAIEYLRK